MKRYCDYMDSVTVSDTLHEKLMGLDAHPKKPRAWKKYGAMAAALVLVLGLGAWGLSRGNQHTTPAIGTTEAIGQPDIAILPGGETAETPTGGGYEVIDGKTAMYCLLPYLNYVEEDGLTADYSLAPPSALHREADAGDAAALVGGEENMVVHLAWDSALEWGGTVWILEDGTVCSASLWAEGTDVTFQIELLDGGAVPDCIRYPDDSYVTTQFCGVSIQALKNTGYAVRDGVELRESRKVSFVTTNGMGCKLTIYGVDGERVEELCARFARWAIVEGFDLSALSDGAEAGLADSGYSVSEPRSETSPCAPASQWGAVLTARDVTPTGMTLVLSRVEGCPTGELQTGTWYRLERQEDGVWTALETLPQEENVGWESIAWLFPEPGQEGYEHTVDWEWLYGALPAGQYRMVKEVMDFRTAGDYNTAEFYAEFVIE